MFKENKYSKWYNRIIANAQARHYTQGYTEKHHIVPRSCGGLDNIENLVVLTAREHFVCHMLLPKMVKGSNRKKMLFALWAMCNQRSEGQDNRYTPNSRIYEQIKKQAVEVIREASIAQDKSHLKGREITWADKISKTLKGRKPTAERNAKVSASLTGRKRSAKECAAISAGLKGRPAPWAKQPRSEETKLKMSEAAKHRPKKHCPYCNRDIAITSYNKYHGENCKQKQ